MAATVQADLKARCEADATLMAIATGGVHVATTRRGPIHLDGSMYQTLPGSGGVKTLAPCIVISRSADVGIGPRNIGLEAVYRFGCYEADGYVNTSAMVDRLRALLHDQVFTLDNGCQYLIYHFGNPIRESQDDTVVTGGGKKGASYEAARFTVVQR